MENKKTNLRKKQGKSLTKRITGWLHLWLGLVSGIIVFTVTLSGTIFVFCDEIIDLFGGSAKYVQAPANIKKMTPEQLLVQFHQQVPDRKPFYFDTYKDANRSFRVASATQPPENKNAEKAAKPKGRGPRGVFAYHYLDPYRGKVIGSTKSYEFFLCGSSYPCAVTGWEIRENGSRHCFHYLFHSAAGWFDIVVAKKMEQNDKDGCI